MSTPLLSRISLSHLAIDEDVNGLCGAIIAKRSWEFSLLQDCVRFSYSARHFTGHRFSSCGNTEIKRGSIPLDFPTSCQLHVSHGRRDEPDLMICVLKQESVTLLVSSSRGSELRIHSLLVNSNIEELWQRPRYLNTLA